jgi:hypothetical protein
VLITTVSVTEALALSSVNKANLLLALAGPLKRTVWNLIGISGKNEVSKAMPI